MQFPIVELKGQYVLDIPDTEIPAFRPVEIPEKVMLPADTYIYGGGSIVTVDNVRIPRTGVSGKMPIPIFPKLTHYKKRGARKWIYITEEPTLTAGYWRSGFWRASIPRAIRVKYRILPGNDVLLVYTEKVPAWLVSVYHLGREYTARWYPREHVVRWVIPIDMLCYTAIDTALESGIACSGDCHITTDGVTVDIVFSDFGGRRTSQKTERCYRYMAVRNFNLENEIGEYPVNAEIRATYITTCPKEYCYSENNFMPLTNAIEITIRNLQSWFLYSFEKSLKPKDDRNPVIDTFDGTDTMFGKRNLKRGGRMKVTKGYTEPQELHPSLVRDFPFYRCHLYARITLPRWEHEYPDGEIRSKLLSRLRKLEKEDKIPPGLVYFDVEGFLWKRK